MSALKIKKLNDDAKIPFYATEDAAGMDLSSLDEIEIKPLERKLISTGLSIALPKGTEAQIRPRSGLALKHGITVLNTPGTIDADYRGEIKVLLVNFSNETFKVEKHMRVAQMIIAKYEKLDVIESELDETVRGTGGYGSTGTDHQKVS